MVLPYESCWGEGAIQDGQSVSEIWQLTFPTDAPTTSPTSSPTKSPATPAPTERPTVSPSMKPQPPGCTAGSASSNENVQKASLWLRGPADADGGRVVFGATADVNLFRNTAAQLQTESTFVANGFIDTSTGRRLGAREAEEADKLRESVEALQRVVEEQDARIAKLEALLAQQLTKEADK